MDCDCTANYCDGVFSDSPQVLFSQSRAMLLCSDQLALSHGIREANRRCLPRSISVADQKMRATGFGALFWLATLIGGSCLERY